MKELYLKALKAHADMLAIHIDSKTKNTEFHEATEPFYEALFTAAHKIWEKYVDRWWKMVDLGLDEEKKKANEIIVNLKQEIEDYAKNNDITMGEEDMLWSLVNDLEFVEGTSRTFLPENK